MNDDFTKLVESLADAGYTRIHFLLHSMGAMILNSALSHPPFFRLFKRPGTDARPRGSGGAQNRDGDSEIGEGGNSTGDDSDGGRVRMSTAIYINPDASLERFKEVDYALLRRVCGARACSRRAHRHITRCLGTLACLQRFSSWRVLPPGLRSHHIVRGPRRRGPLLLGDVQPHPRPRQAPIPALLG